MELDLDKKDFMMGNLLNLIVIVTRNIINIGGTFLKSARFPEFKDPKVREEAIEQMKKVGMEALVVIWGRWKL